MTLFGVSFLVAGMMTCLIPIGLLIVFATFFGRAVRRLPPNATPGRRMESELPSSDPRVPEHQG